MTTFTFKSIKSCVKLLRFKCVNMSNGRGNQHLRNKKIDSRNGATIQKLCTIEDSENNGAVESIMQMAPPTPTAKGAKSNFLASQGG